MLNLYNENISNDDSEDSLEINIFIKKLHVRHVR